MSKLKSKAMCMHMDNGSEKKIEKNPYGFGSLYFGRIIPFFFYLFDQCLLSLQDILLESGILFTQLRWKI